MVLAETAFSGLSVEGSCEGGGGGDPCTDCDHYTGNLI
jgi:hypothetical protein